MLLDILAKFRLIQVLCNLIFEIKAARLMNLAPPSVITNVILTTPLCAPVCFVSCHCAPSVTSQTEGYCNLKKYGPRSGSRISCRGGPEFCACASQLHIHVASALRSTLGQLPVYIICLCS